MIIKKLIPIFAAFAMLGSTAAIASDDDTSRRLVMKGRQMAWVQPTPERPYALTGATERGESGPSMLGRIQGRAGHRVTPR